MYRTNSEVCGSAESIRTEHFPHPGDTARRPVRRGSALRRSATNTGNSVPACGSSRRLRRSIPARSRTSRHRPAARRLRGSYPRGPRHQLRHRSERHPEPQNPCKHSLSTTCRTPRFELWSRRSRVRFPSLTLPAANPCMPASSVCSRAKHASLPRPWPAGERRVRLRRRWCATTKTCPARSSLIWTATGVS